MLAKILNLKFSKAKMVKLAKMLNSAFWKAKIRGSGFRKPRSSSHPKSSFKEFGTLKS